MSRTILEDARRVHFISLLCDNSGSMGTDVRRKAAARASKGALAVFRAREEDLEKIDGRKETLRISIALLNGSYLGKDQHPADLVVEDENTFACGGNTPLYERSLEVLRDLVATVRLVRAESRKARGHLIWFSDGEATDEGNTSAVAELKELVASLLNPRAPNGEKETQLFDLFAIPIGPKARAFFEGIGVPNDHIFDVPDALSETFSEQLKEAVERASIVAAFGVHLPALELTVVPAPADNSQGEVQEELPGDIMMRLSKARREKRKASSIKIPWLRKKTD